LAHGKLSLRFTDEQVMETPAVVVERLAAIMTRRGTRRADPRATARLRVSLSVGTDVMKRTVLPTALVAALLVALPATAMAAKPRARVTNHVQEVDGKTTQVVTVRYRATGGADRVGISTGSHNISFEGNRNVTVGKGCIRIGKQSATCSLPKRTH